MLERGNLTICSNAKSVITKYQTDMAVELQQRAVEFGQIFGFDAETRYRYFIVSIDVQFTSFRIALLERMPILESAAAEEARKGSGAVLGGGIVLVYICPSSFLFMFMKI